MHVYLYVLIEETGFIRKKTIAFFVG